MADYTAYNLVTTSATLIYTPGQAGVVTSVGGGASPSNVSGGFMRGGRERVTIQNLGPNAIYIGRDSSVATTTGMQIPAGGVASLDYPQTPYYGIAVTANQSSPANTRVDVEEVVR